MKVAVVAVSIGTTISAAKAREDGTPIIRNDPYNWNDRVALALGFAASNSLGLKAGKEDVGP